MSDFCCGVENLNFNEDKYLAVRLFSQNMCVGMCMLTECRPKMCVVLQSKNTSWIPSRANWPLNVTWTRNKLNVHKFIS